MQVKIIKFIKLKKNYHTLKPLSLRANEMCTLTVDFPTPPFPDITNKIFLTPSNIFFKK